MPGGNVYLSVCDLFVTTRYLRVNRKLTLIYLFDLNMSNMKSVALVQECFKRNVFLENLRNSLKNNCVQESLLWWRRSPHGSFRFTFYPAQVLFSEIREIFENTNNSVEHLRSCKVICKLSIL